MSKQNLKKPIMTEDQLEAIAEVTKEALTEDFPGIGFCIVLTAKDARGGEDNTVVLSNLDTKQLSDFFGEMVVGERPINLNS